MKVCRIYERVSTDSQDLTRQQALEDQARAAGYYVAGVYAEKASGTTAERPELQRMIADLQPGEVVIAEKIDRISRLPLADAEKLVASIKAKGAKLAVPGVVDLSELAATAEGTAKIVLESVQAMLLRLALQMARDDYETRRERQRQGILLAKGIEGKYAGRKADILTHERIVELRKGDCTISKTAKLAGCSTAQVKRIWAEHKAAAAAKVVPPVPSIAAPVQAKAKGAKKTSEPSDWAKARRSIQEFELGWAVRILQANKGGLSVEEIAAEMHMTPEKVTGLLADEKLMKEARKLAACKAGM